MSPGKTDRSLGIRLRAAREALGLTQAQLAGDEYSVAYVSRLESGERTPSPEALSVFARRLGTSPETLLSPIDERTLARLEILRVTASRAMLDADWDEAKTAAEEMLILAEEHDASQFRATALRTLGEIEERHIGNPERGVELYRQAQKADPGASIEDRVELVVAISRAYRTLGDLGHCVSLLERLSEELEPSAAQYPALMARVCTQLTAAYHERGDIVRAREVSIQGVEYARAAGDRRALAGALWAAAPPMAAADPARALSLIRRAGTLYA